MSVMRGHQPGEWYTRRSPPKQKLKDNTKHRTGARDTSKPEAAAQANRPDVLLLLFFLNRLQYRRFGIARRVLDRGSGLARHGRDTLKRRLRIALHGIPVDVL